MQISDPDLAALNITYIPYQVSYHKILAMRKVLLLQQSTIHYITKDLFDGV